MTSMMAMMNTFLTVILMLVSTKSVHTFDCHSPKNGEKLQIHLVPHSHDDVGWLKTVDQYYWGANMTIDGSGVQYILDTVVRELSRDPSKKFIYVEMAFFKRWWDQQDEKTRVLVKKLVKERRLEFINGGWSMNDEAATHYNAIIDQMTYGLRFIQQTFGDDARPTVAWHIDPFGHSAEQASLFSQMSFDGFFLGRIDWADRDNRLKKQQMEMMWRGSRNLEKKSEVFTAVLYNWYFPPPTFCYDMWCMDPQIQDDPRLFDMNVKERVNAFVKVTCDQAKHYKTKNIILTMGGDFNYQNARAWYKNLDKLIRYVNQDGRVNVFYSTPSLYLKALHDANKTWEVKTDDFFPYCHRPHAYWTGYFTSRPALKRYIRESNTILQVCKQMEAFAGNIAFNHSSDYLRRATAVNQHHDAVTGTEKQHVANDYAKRLHMGRSDCQSVFNSFLKSEYSASQQSMISAGSLNFQRCDYLNISVCHLTESGASLVVNFYNPTARLLETDARFPVNSRKVQIVGPDGKSLKLQVQPLSAVTKSLRGDMKGFAAYEAILPIVIPRLGFSTYFINPERSGTREIIPPAQAKKMHVKNGRNSIENEYLKLEFSPDTGRLIRMTNKMENIVQKVEQNFYYYEGADAKLKPKNHPSGAYLFRPREQKPLNFDKYGKSVATILEGPFVSEIRQVFCPFVSQVIRLYKNKLYAEFEYTIGPIPIEDETGKEIITRFDTDINNNDLFYTDANGREMKQRKRDYRETWDLDLMTEPVSRNYYPVNSRISINDSLAQLTVLTDRSQGGSSIRNGQVEVMIHRRLLHDDYLGVEEALNEKGRSGKGLVTRGKYHVFLTTPKTAARFHRLEGERMFMEPVISLSKNPYPIDKWKGSKMVHSAMYHDKQGFHLPLGIRVLTLETTDRKDQLLLRLEHYFEKDDDPLYSKPAKVDLRKIFADFTVISFVETNLSANQLLKNKKMWKWKIRSQSNEEAEVPNSSTKNDSFEVSLQPMQIRTFLLSVKYSCEVVKNVVNLEL